MRRWIIIGLGTVFGSNVLNAVTAADFDGDSRDDVAVFRPASGLWAVQGVTRAYFGGSGDEPRPGDYDGDGIADIAIFRPAVGLWAVRGVTRTYFGGSTDAPLAGGGGQRLYDYVVKPNDGADLVAALESDTYCSVFIPDGSYSVASVINVGNVRHITGESKRGTQINFSGGAYLSIEEDYCQIDNLYLYNGGDSGHGALHIPGTEWVTVADCRFGGPGTTSGLRYEDGSEFLKVSNCYAVVGGHGFLGPSGSTFPTVSFSNCQANNCGDSGFSYCSNLSSCEVQGNGEYTDYGFYGCSRLSSCRVEGTNLAGFYNCGWLSACTVDGDSGTTDYGFQNCDYLSSCAAFDCGSAEWLLCTKKDADSCN